MLLGNELASWNTRIQMPERSRLYHLVPCGTRTELCEGLSSYVVRLAHNHGVPPVDVFSETIVPLLVRIPRTLRKHEVEIYSILASERVINDYLESAGWLRSTRKIEKLLEALQQLTLRPDLRALIYIHRGRRHQYLYRSCRAWCPDCHQQQRQQHAPIYDPLYWMFTSSNYCAIHNYPLETKCPHCNRRSAPITSFAKPGHCYNCGCWLGQFARDTYGPTT